MTYRLEVTPDEAWAGSVADEWVARIRDHPALRMCLPTGATPRPVYAAVASLASFGQTTLFILDEFGLPSGDPARCDRMLAHDLLALLEPPPRRVESLDPETGSPDAECRRYSAVVADGGLDLTILGLGGNGHLGLNEPGSSVDSVTRVVELAEETKSSLVRYGARTQTDWGMTLGIAEIMASAEVWLLVRGGHKADVLRRVLNDPIGPMIPGTYLRDHHNLVIWADQAASGRV